MPIGVMTTKAFLLSMLASSLAFSGCMDAEDDAWDTSSEESHEAQHRHRHHAESRSSTEVPVAEQHEHLEGEYCSSEGIRDHDIESAHPDASERYAHLLDGNERATRTFMVGPQTTSVRVATLYDLHGDVRITLLDPLGRRMAETEMDGHKEADEPSWFESETPLIGRWKLDISMHETHGGYSIGVYVT